MEHSRKTGGNSNKYRNLICDKITFSLVGTDLVYFVKMLVLFTFYLGKILDPCVIPYTNSVTLRQDRKKLGKTPTSGMKK